MSETPVIHAEMLHTVTLNYLNAMAKPYRLYTCISLHISCKDTHGISIIQKPRIRANLLHIACKVLKHVDGTKPSEYTADAEGITDSLAQSVFLRYFKVRIPHQRTLTYYLFYYSG